jgi:hypothetical protein
MGEIMKTTLLLSTLGVIASTVAFAQNPGASYAQAVGSGPTSVSHPDMGYQPPPAGQKHRVVVHNRATKHVPTSENQ